MLSNIQKIIILRALKIRQGQGEQPEAILDGYKSLTDKEKAELLKLLAG